MISRDSEPLRVAIAGAGALGCLFAQLLDRPGFVVDVITRRPDLVDVLNEHGVTVHDERDPAQRVTTTTAVRARSAAHTDRAAYDVVVLLAKASDIEPATELGFALVAEDGIVVSMQNGLRSADVVEGRGRQGVAGATWQGAVAAGPGAVRWTSQGPTFVAPRPPVRAVVDAVAARIDDDRFPFASVADRDVMLWEKLVAAVSNSLSGALLLPVSDLLGSPKAHAILDAARAEAVAVAGAAGVAIDGGALLARLRAAGVGSVGATAGSTWQSLVSGRRPEVDDISGAIATLARQHGVATPVNDLLDQLVAARLQVAGVDR